MNQGGTYILLWFCTFPHSQVLLAQALHYLDNNTQSQSVPPVSHSTITVTAAVMMSPTITPHSELQAKQALIGKDHVYTVCTDTCVSPESQNMEAFHLHITTLAVLYRRYCARPYAMIHTCEESLGC
eukprot:4177617-Pyramimonas_sp.AAC.1